MLKMILIVAAIAVAGLLVYAALRPSTFRIERRIAIAAPPEKVYAILADFRRWAAWSPWERMDPAMQRAHSGAESGKGAVYAWEGNRKVGKGRMEIVESDAPSRLLIQLDFLAPFEAHNMAEFALRTNGAFTIVTWAMYGPQPYMVRLFGIFADIDAMVGRDFDNGLANLKAIAER